MAEGIKRDVFGKIELSRTEVESSKGGEFLASLDGTANQAPYLFVQLYPNGAIPATPVSQAAVVAAFGAADVLAAFLTLPDI